VGRASASHHAAEVPGLDRVNRGSADADLSIRVFGIQAAGSHGAMFAASGIRADGAGFHICGTVKSRLHAVLFCFSEHLSRGVANRDFSNVETFLFNFLLNLLSLFLFHYFSSFVDFNSFREY
jgi:hypothetical protein